MEFTIMTYVEKGLVEVLDERQRLIQCEYRAEWDYEGLNWGVDPQCADTTETFELIDATIIDNDGDPQDEWLTQTEYAQLESFLEHNVEYEQV